MLWVFVLFNYLYADILILVLRPGAYEAVVARMSPTAMLGVTLFFELFLAMPLLSWVLGHTANRWINIITGVTGTLWVATTLSPQQPPAYLALCAIEMISTGFIAWYAWTWSSPEPEHTEVQ
jgi:hypothetical protein